MSSRYCDNNSTFNFVTVSGWVFCGRECYSASISISSLLSRCSARIKSYKQRAGSPPVLRLLWPPCPWRREQFKKPSRYISRGHRCQSSGILDPIVSMTLRKLLYESPRPMDIFLISSLSPRCLRRQYQIRARSRYLNRGHCVTVCVCGKGAFDDTPEALV